MVWRGGGLMRGDRLARAIGAALLALVLETHVKMAARGMPPVGGGTLEPLSPTLRERVAAPLGDALGRRCCGRRRPPRPPLRPRSCWR